MTGAAIASVAVGAFQGHKAGKAADKASKQQAAAAARQQQLAEEQYAYSKEMMGKYTDQTMQDRQYVEDMQWGGGEVRGYEGGYNMRPAGSGGGAVGGDTGGIGAAQGMLDQWENVFGSIETNMSNYYKNLDPVKFATQSKVNLQQSLDRSMKQFNDTMAANGLQSAGMKQQAAKEAAFAQAAGNAGIDINAPEQVAQMQQGFLNYGSGAKTQAQGLLSGAYQTDANLQTQASVANMNSRDAMSRFNAGREDNMYQFEAGRQDRADYARNNANIDARNRYADSYRYGANMNNPGIQANQYSSNVYGDQASNYGKSQAGYYGMAGQGLGTAINLGIKKNGNKSAPYGGVDDGWMY